VFDIQKICNETRKKVSTNISCRHLLFCPVI